VGASAGQYASERYEDNETETGMDPHAQSVRRAKSYGVQSRLTVRAIVLQGCDGTTAALVKTDHYLSQDAVQRRVGQILAANGSAVTYDNVLMAATHNHNSPYLVTPSWGVWAFQDAFDARMFEFFARRAAAAILAAEADLQPARMGATTVHHDVYKANIPGPEDADDKTPGGYPRVFGDEEVVVMRFDNADTGKPIASWVNFGQHPESLEPYDLISADYLGPLERQVAEGTGAPMVFSQADVGSSEGPYDGWNAPPRWLPDGTRRAWAHMGYAQAERGARYLADSVIEGFNAIGAGGGTVPYSTDFEVGSYNGWIPFPKSHPYPSVSNCRTESTAEADPGAPVVGLPDCERAMDPDPNMVIWENLKQHGLPVPEHYDAPSFAAVEENMRLRLQAIRVGEVILGSCSCEAQVDLIKNFESRADDVVGNLWDGYEWKCSRPGYGDGDPNVDHTWTCEYPDNASGTKNYTFSDYEYDRMLAQVHNDAAGWDTPEYLPYANTEPYELSEIKGNFTKEELGGSGEAADGESVLPTTGYKLAVGIGHAGDYTGYTVSYREYMNRDTYRKALTCCGPHTADYMSTNLVHMAMALKGGPDPVADNPYYQAQAADEARQVAFTTALGETTSAAYDQWYAALPDDSNPGQVLSQPKDIERFDAATFSWTGGANVIDSPRVAVQRLTDEGWVTYGDQSGEVQTFLDMPDAGTGQATTYSGSEQWEWTANFEAFDFGPRRDLDPNGPQVPSGDYRFVVAGRYRAGGTDHDYELVSDTFNVSRWDGIKVQDFRAESGGVSFAVEGAKNATETDIAPGLARPQIRYPRTYDAAPVIRFISDDGRRDICMTCTFRPWAVGSDVATATVTVERADGTVEEVPAALRDGRWFADVELYEGDRAFVARAGIVDTYGEINGEPSAVVGGTAPRPSLETALDYSGATSGQYTDQATFSARLTDPKGGVANEDVTFTLTGPGGSDTWTATTNQDGVATRSVELGLVPGDYELSARFAGTARHLGSVAEGTFVIAKEDSSTTLSISGRESKAPKLVAELSDADTASRPIAGVVVTFYKNGTEIGQAETTAGGVATLTDPAPRGKGSKAKYEARFAGNDHYLPSSAQV
ncbi:MAG TPA: neutral/alkaline non-lysosomal ceramidase N-terminal domain-containing protein, partial [Actinomycetota bacterium]